MLLDRVELEKHKAELERQIAEVLAYEEKIGPLFVAVTKYHDQLCRRNHVSDCRWEFESDEDFENPGTTARGVWVERYKKAQGTVEGIAGKPLSHDQVSALYRFIYPAR